MKSKTAATVRSLATELGVSAITVSRALRGHPGVRPELRTRIERLARRRGYQADPAMSSVLGSLRKGHGPHYLGTVAFVWTHRLSSAEEEYCGACDQAAALGYRMEAMRPWEQGLSEQDVSRILWSRGIRGVLLSPNHSDPQPRYDLDWGKFAPVLIGSSLVNAGIPRVLRDYYQDGKLAVETVRAKGFKRPGLVLEDSVHERTGRRYAAAFAQHAGLSPAMAAGLTHVIDTRTPEEARRKGLERWLNRSAPDIVLTDFVSYDTWMSGASRSPAYAGLVVRSHETNKMGIKADFRRIGAEAMTLLDGLLRTRRTGLEEHPVNLLVPGFWHEPSPSEKKKLG
jgi:LacI family transcriptional regulator